MRLAINGGIPVRHGLLPEQVTIGDLPEQFNQFYDEEGNFNIDDGEIKSVIKTMKTKKLSGFRGNSSPAFYGGEKIQELEHIFTQIPRQLSWQGISVNSCTSALQLACGAIIEPGDEVIVTPWSMSCSATAPMIFGGIPVFADIEHDYFCLDPKSVEEKITDKTKAIIVVDLFGQPFSYELINIADKHNLIIIEDAAQAIGSSWGKFPAGYIGNIGCFSFTQGKHLTSGEGGMLVCRKDSPLTRKLQLLRNHAEAVVSDMNVETDLNDLVGFNMRLTEIQATILTEQLRKLHSFVERRQKNAFYFTEHLDKIPAIRPAPVRPDCTHSYYVQAFFWDQEKAEGIHRDTFIQAVKAELKPQIGRTDLGVPISCGYVKPLYRMPLFQKAQHWSIRNRHYWQIHNPLSSIELPVVEKLWKDEVFLWTLNGLDLNDQDRSDIAEAFHKVWNYKSELLI